MSAADDLHCGVIKQAFGDTNLPRGVELVI